MARKSIIVYGGGLVDCAKDILMLLAREISKWNTFSEVYIGKYSFLSLFQEAYEGEKLQLLYNEELEDEVADKCGGYFGTARGIRFDEKPKLFEQSITFLKAHEITNIYVVGGDGSARFVADVAKRYYRNGIYISYLLPCTVDGINGGYSVGIEQATRVSIKMIENMVSTSLKTLDNNKFGVVIVEVQGRNRDDILSNVMNTFERKKCVAEFPLSSLNIFAIPANIEVDILKIISKINNSNKRSIIVISEGAKCGYEKIFDKLPAFFPDKKVRTMCIGHVSQMNQETTNEDRKAYGTLIKKITDLAKEYTEDSINVVIKEDGSAIFECFKYFADLNPERIKKVTVPDDVFRKLVPFLIFNGYSD